MTVIAQQPLEATLQRRLPLATLVAGGQAGKREAAISQIISSLQPASPGSVSNIHAGGARTAVILEGLADGTDRFANKNGNLTAIRIAPACPCCIGNLTMRVTLNRVLRHPPERLYISLANDTHLAHFRDFLASPPYDAHLELTDDLRIE